MNTKYTIVALAISLLSMTAVSTAHADVINFDNISLSPNDAAPLTGLYQGFSWSDFYALNTSGDVYDHSGYVPGTTSLSNVGFNFEGKTASFSSASAFTLNSFDLTAVWLDHMTVTVRGTGDHGVDHIATLDPSATTATAYTLNWVDIKRVTFEATGGSQHSTYARSTELGFAGGVATNFAIDNITYNVAVVPEPETYAMLLAGLGALGFVGRRRRKVS